nr:MAG TPA: LPS-assembly protein [Caudoviricetes sp.]
MLVVAAFVPLGSVGGSLISGVELGGCGYTPRGGYHAAPHHPLTWVNIPKI